MGGICNEIDRQSEGGDVIDIRIDLPLIKGNAVDVDVVSSGDDAAADGM